jgi:4a-hydroxytetrahydrobiopterin dehydratase
MTNENPLRTLADEHCTPVTRQSQRATEHERSALLERLPEWRVIEVDGIERLEREFSLPDFERAMAFTNRVGALAESENHHPALVTEWGRVKVSWWTHTVRGLHRNDFVMAAQTDRAYARAAP